MLSKLSIRTKVTCLVAVLLVSLVVQGLFSFVQMRTLNSSTVEIAANWLPSVRILGELRSQVALYRTAVRSHLIEGTEEGKAKVEKQIEALDDTIKQTRRAYEPLISSPEEQRIYDDWVRAWTTYTTELPNGLAMSRKSLGQLPTEANAVMTRTMGPAGRQADELLKKDIDLNNRGSEHSSAAAASSYGSAVVVMISLLVASVVISVGASFLVIREVTRSIGSIVEPMLQFAEGDLSAEVPHRGEATEIGSMADALQVFKEALIARREANELAAKEAEDKIARGQRIDQATRRFETSVGEIVETVSSASTELEASAETLTSTAEMAQRLSTAVAAASEQASANVQSVATATEEMTSSIHEISRQVQESARIAGDAVDQAKKTNDTVGALSEAAARIGDVVELINTIAGQTNLLALNATIEAARAGEAGRGFAVVASEVKALAEQTSKATGEIGQHITGIQAATTESVAAIREISLTIDRISEIASTIASAVEEQGAATQEISRNVQQAARGTQEVSANVTEVQRGATETGSASTEVLSSAQSLSREGSRLKLEVASFLRSVRAA